MPPWLYYKIPPWLYYKIEGFNGNPGFRERFKKKAEKMDPATDHDLNMVTTRSIFIHIPKTAGISVAHGLYGGWENKLLPDIIMGHAPVRTYQWVFLPRDFKSYFKFTFVRNPWDRVSSAYRFLCNGGLYEQDQVWAKKNIGSLSFEGFVMQKLAKDLCIMQWVHFIPQHYYLRSYNGKDYPTDFIGFYENLQEDFDFIKTKVNPDAALPKLNQSENSTNNYQQEYTPEMIEVVRSCYSEDIALFGYGFNNSSLHTQLKKRARSQLLIQGTG